MTGRGNPVNWRGRSPARSGRSVRSAQAHDVLPTCRRALRRPRLGTLRAPADCRRPVGRARSVRPPASSPARASMRSSGSSSSAHLLPFRSLLRVLSSRATRMPDFGLTAGAKECPRKRVSACIGAIACHGAWKATSFGAGEMPHWGNCPIDDRATPIPRNRRAFTLATGAFQASPLPRRDHGCMSRRPRPNSRDLDLSHVIAGERSDTRRRGRGHFRQSIGPWKRRRETRAYFVPGPGRHSRNVTSRPRSPAPHRECPWRARRPPACESRSGLEPLLPWASYAFLRSEAVRITPVDSNSTRTGSCVAIRLDPEARMPGDAPKAAGHNGWRQITVQAVRWGRV